jgi:hypothetical protein
LHFAFVVIVILNCDEKNPVTVKVVQIRRQCHPGPAPILQIQRVAYAIDGMEGFGAFPQLW